MQSSMLRAIQAAVLVLIGVNLIGCASVTMPPPVASASNLEKIRSANLTPSNVGRFGIMPDAAPSMDNSLGGLRGSSLRPSNGSFSQHLREVVIAELKAAGLYDASSQIEIGAQLTESQVDTAIGTGTAKLGANFTVDKAGVRVFEKILSVDSQWESSFVGAIAIPEATNQYSALYKALVGKLFDDIGFRTALAR